MKATFIGVGVGPGDPELMTLKAARYIEQADIISYIANAKGVSQAKTIAREALLRRKSTQEIPVIMPMSEDRYIANKAYDAAAASIGQSLQAGLTVVFLCEGDPLFFGSFAYLLERLQGLVICEVVPGISSVHAASSALQLPLTMQKESFAVISGRHSQQKMIDTLNNHDSVVILKAGRSRQSILDAISAANRTDDANYLEYISRDNQKIQRDICALEGEAGPYFSLFIITKTTQGRGQ
ncbi:precorrin-2 C(20)-methyltransferase [Marinagarivorans algicola]|uniref:precorrin-2 C(20)-methyltransferase n=1 Tax=Marinagarivorans algicola TaxID=1513270 RepID=UPI0006B4015C|nr:precorrin-2 C(20)-methyltransferase [Marinagarivorans algicola]